MEGIFDGRAVDGCFVCELLYPEAFGHDCPRCGRRMRYQPAIMMTPAELHARLQGRIRAYEQAGAAAPRTARLVALLDDVHRFAPMSLEVLGELGAPGLDAWRRDFSALCPELSPA